MTIGNAAQRVDAVAKVSGRARYTEDLGLAGMWQAVYVRSPVAHALVTHIDATQALALPGVEAVFTAAHVPTHSFATAGHPYALHPAEADVADRRLLTDHVRFYGDEVAVVVARDLLTARKAAAMVDVSYSPLPVVLTPQDAMAAEAPLLHPELARGGTVQGNVLHAHCLESPEPGAFQTALDDGAGLKVTQGSFHTSVQQHCHMEVFTAYAYMEDNTHIIIVSSTQIPHICRRIVAEALHMDWGCVRVVKPCVGGGFGAKQDVVLEPMVAFLTRQLGGRPVALTLSREECMLTRTRHAFAIQGQAAATAEGVLTALALDVTSNTGGYASHGHTIAAAGGDKLISLYPHAVFRYAARTVYTNMPVAGAMRGYGAPQVAYAVDCLVEDMARALGQDSVDFRLRNVARPGDPYPLKHKNLDTAGIAQCLSQGRELFHWDARKKACPRSGALRRGVGVACFSYGSSTYPSGVEVSSVRMLLNQDGSVTLMAGITEIGQGADTVLAQMAASTLNMDFDAFHVVSTQDTDVSPFDPGSYASRQTYVASNAVRQCATELRGKILAEASRICTCPVETLRLAGRHVYAGPPPGRRATDQANAQPVLSLAELSRNAYYHKIEGSGQISAEVSRKTCANAPCFGATFVEVEVDIPLCRLKVVDMLNIHDSGVIINPLLAKGQVQGGAAMALGWAMAEELLVHPQSGVVLNNNLLDYKIPTILDLPDIDAAFVETQEPSSGYGNKALGEPPIVSPAPAVRNALLDATGVAVNELPLSPKHLFRYFAAAGLLEGYDHV